jgi:glycosyltransferase involved in cell wall biosynthesis
MSKRIALIGNMNNNFFSITRYLRDLGYDAHMFFRLGADHFQPKADTYTLGYESYCHEIDWLAKGFYNIDIPAIQKILHGFDFFIGQGDEAAVAHRCGILFDVYYPYGSDVSKYSYLPQEFNLRHKLTSFVRRYNKHQLNYTQMKHGTMSKYQRGAITTAKHILAEYTNEEYVGKLSGLNYTGKFEKVPMPFIYLKDYEQLISGYTPDTHWRSEIDKLRSENQFLLLYHGRQEWKTFHYEFNGKNTHHLIIGFANFIKSRPALKAKLVMLEYGNDVQHSKDLIKELGIEQNVKWFPKMYRKDLMYLVKNADVCTGEFGYSYLTFGTVVEAMLMKKLVIHYREDHLYTDVYPELYPMLHAKTPEEIEKAISFAVNNPAEIQQMGEKACEWVKTNFIERPVKFLQQLIEEKNKTVG